MSESLADWLALREAADAAGRSAELTSLVAAKLSTRRPVRVLDLGTGTGSNVRYLAPRLPHPQQWLAVDRDESVLEALEQRLGDAVETRQANLGTLTPDLIAGRDLVTASALLDLVSETWLRTLAAACRQAGAIALFALTYNGNSRCAPREPEDDVVRDLMNRHQRQNDKGFGRAAGPDAVAAAERAFSAEGYTVRRAPSDWTLEPAEGALQRELIRGWAEAAAEIAPDRTIDIEHWLARRLAHVDAGRSRVVVGHDDLAAWPEGNLL